jgi:hypothetical protein
MRLNTKEPEMTVRLASGGTTAQFIEATTAGLAFGAVLCWVSACLVSTFRPQDLGDPYWSGIPGLRTDNSGTASFIVAAICLAVSEYLRLRRRRLVEHSQPVQQASGGPDGTVALIVLAMSRMVAILSIGLVIYLSLNSVTHPASLQIHTTHLLSWPAEGTLRVVALLLCVCSVAVLRYHRAATAVRETCNRPQTD